MSLTVKSQTRCQILDLFSFNVDLAQTQEHSSSFTKLLTKLVQKFLRISYNFFFEISYKKSKFLTKFIEISYKGLPNFLLSSHKFLVNY